MSLTRSFTFVFVGLFCCFGICKAQNEKWKELEVEGDTLMAHEDYEDALAKYNRVAKVTALKDSSTYNIYFKRSVCLYNLEQYYDALQSVDKFIALRPASHEATLLKAYIGKELDDAKIQISSLSDLLLHDPKNIEFLKWRSAAFIDAGLYPEARRDIFVAQKINNDAELEGYMGVSYYYEDKPDSSILHFDKAIALEKDYITSYLYAASLCLDEDAYDLALIYANRGLQIDTKNITLQFYKGIALVEKQDLDIGCSLLYKAFKAGVDDAGDYLKEFCYGVE